MNEKIQTRQRMHQLKREFWQIFQSNEYCPVYKKWEKTINSTGFEQQQLVKRHFKVWSQTFRNHKHTTYFLLERNIEEIIAGKIYPVPEMAKWYERVQQDIKSELHRLICYDVVDFLSSKHGDKWLYRCFVVAWTDAMYQCQQGRSHNLSPDAFNLGNLHYQMQLKHLQITYQLALMIVTSPWTQKLSDLHDNAIRQQIA